MIELYSFAKARAFLSRAAAAGTIAAAEELAAALRREGVAAVVESRLDGTATVALEGAGAVAREFGTRTSPARPLLGPALHESRPRMLDAMTRDVRRTISRARP